MKRSLLFSLASTGFLLLCLSASLRLSAQTDGSCFFSFEPEYVGEGNCFRVVLRNNDPQRAPHNVVFTFVDDSVWFAGGLDPSRLIGDVEQQSWYFRDYQSLDFGVADTGYLCLVATVPTVRLALMWLDGHSKVLCMDTVQIDLPRPHNTCTDMAYFDLNCTHIANERKEPEGVNVILGSVGEKEHVPAYFSINLKNQMQKDIASCDIVGTGCGGEPTGVLRIPLDHSVKPGGALSLTIGGDGPICFEVDSEVGWKIETVRLIYYDAADSPLCVDTITFLFDKFSCVLGGVAESGHSAESSLSLRAAGMESGGVSVAFTLEKRTDVRLWLADMNGNTVAVAIDDHVLEAGTHKAVLHTAELPSGTYLCVLQAGEKRESRLVQIVK